MQEKKAGITFADIVYKGSGRTPIELLQSENASLRQQLAEAQERSSDIAGCYNRLLEEVKWQPIETAPKDGRKILVCSNIGFIAFARWKVIFGEGNWNTMGGGITQPDDITHWMPLPKAPEEADNG